MNTVEVSLYSICIIVFTSHIAGASYEVDRTPKNRPSGTVTEAQQISHIQGQHPKACAIMPHGHQLCHDWSVSDIV